jgi:hypothetical protein
VKLKRAFIRLPEIIRREAAKTGGLADAIQEFLKSPKLGTFGVWRGLFFVRMRFLSRWALKGTIRQKE